MTASTHPSRRYSRPALIAAAIFVLAGASCPNRPVTAVRKLGGLQLRCEPSAAEIFVDDRYVGTVKGLGGRPLMLPEGDRRIEFKADGFFSEYREIRVVKGRCCAVEASPNVV